MPRPTSTLPLPPVIDCEKDLNDEEIKMRANIIARTKGTIRFIDTRFYWFLLLDLQRTK
jgi:hypothetical protein